MIVEQSSGGLCAEWTFLNNHSQFLIRLAHDPSLRLRDVAVKVGITERAVQRLVADLEEAGIVMHIREGCRHRYAFHGERHQRRPIEANTTVGAIMAVLLGSGAK